MKTFIVKYPSGQSTRTDEIQGSELRGVYDGDSVFIDDDNGNTVAVFSRENIIGIYLKEQ